MATVPEATVDEESRDAIIELIKDNDIAGVRAMLQDLPQLLEGAKDWVRCIPKNELDGFSGTDLLRLLMCCFFINFDPPEGRRWIAGNCLLA